MSKETPQYRCSTCHHIFTKAWSDKEAEQEALQYWPDIERTECAVICDTCFQVLFPQEHAASLDDMQMEPISQEEYNRIVRRIAEIYRVSWSMLGLERDGQA